MSNPMTQTDRLKAAQDALRERQGILREAVERVEQRINASFGADSDPNGPQLRAQLGEVERTLAILDEIAGEARSD